MSREEIEHLVKEHESATKIQAVYRGKETDKRLFKKRRILSRYKLA